MPDSPQADDLNTSVYRSYLVRFWQSNPQGRWRASAQSVQTGSTLHFGDVASLLAFLQGEIGEHHQANTAEHTLDEGAANATLK